MHARGRGLLGADLGACLGTELGRKICAAALKGILRGMTLEKKDKMSIFELVLGAMKSPMLLNNVDKKEIEELKNGLPSKKILTTDEVANLIIDLVNNHASILHGSSIVIDNGVLSKLPTK